MMNPTLIHRRAFLGQGALGLGAVALASLADPRVGNAASGGVLNPPPLPIKAKRVIWMTMAGGPSHLETFDHKPKLAELDGQPMPESFTKGQQLAQLQGQKLICLRPLFPFTKHGQNQTEISVLFPNIASVIDDSCLAANLQSLP